MSDVLKEVRSTFGGALGGRKGSRRFPSLTQYGASALLVAVATLLAFVVDHVVSAPNLTLVFVLPVVIAATTFGWGPALAAVVLSVLAFDFFFTQPYYSLQIANPSDVWAAALLLVTAAIVSTVAAEARRQAVEARRAAAQAQALHGLAQAVIEARPRADVVQAAAVALHEIFSAPAVIFTADEGIVGPTATAGGAMIAPADQDAAQGVFASRIHSRGETYPYDQSAFDFWPVVTPSGGSFVLGVNFNGSDRERPATPERFVEIVGAYLAAARAGDRTPAAAH